MNKIMLIGNLGKDPEMNYTTSGTAVTKFSLAVNHPSKATDGERKTETDWFTIVVWKSLAETCATYLRKGHKVFIGGRLSMRKYTDRENVQRLAVEVIAYEMEILSPKSQATDEGEAEVPVPKQQQGDAEIDALLADLEKQE